MGLPNGVNHLVLNLQDVEVPLEFFTQACGMAMKAFYWMHGGENAYIAFLDLSDPEKRAGIEAAAAEPLE